MSGPAWLNNPSPSHVFRLSVASCILTCFAAIAGVAAYLSTGSSSVLGFGVENIIDFLSSVIVIWRFYAPNMDEMDENYPKVLERREKRASVAISFIMLLLAWALSVAAFEEITEGVKEDDDNDDELLILSIPAMFVFIPLAFIKFRYAGCLNSPALLKDAYCSLFGGILAMSVLVNSFIISNDPDLWILDPLIATFVSIACCLIGVRSILKNLNQGNQIFSLSWWFTDPVTKDDESAEVDTTEKGNTEENENEVV